MDVRSKATTSAAGENALKAHYITSAFCPHSECFYDR